MSGYRCGLWAVHGPTSISSSTATRGTRVHCKELLAPACCGPLLSVSLHNVPLKVEQLKVCVKSCRLMHTISFQLLHAA